MSAPASARAMAMAWPMPRVPPVTTAVCPVSEKSEETVAAILIVVLCVSTETRHGTQSFILPTRGVYLIGNANAVGN